MTITSTQYYVSITGTGTLNEEFSIPFSYDGAEDLYVWAKDSGGVLVRKEVGTDYIVFEDKIRWNGTSPTTDVRIQRHLQQNQLNRYRGATPGAYERILDDVTKRAQQGLINDTRQIKEWSAENERITNLRDAASDDDLSTKKQVDDAIGGGTDDGTVWNIGAGDVGKFATSNGSGYDWQDFSGTPDPKGHEGKILNGVPSWIKVDNLPFDGTGVEDDLLKDVNTVPTWSTPSEYPSGGAAGQALTLEDDGGGGTQMTWRDFYGVPTFLPASNLSVLTRKKSAVTGGLRNEFVDHFGVTKKTVTATLGSYTGTGVNDHQVYQATFNNHLGIIPGFIQVAADTIIDPSGYKTTFVVNIVSMTTTTITIALASLFHKFAPVTNADIYDFESTITVPIRILWVNNA